MIVSHARRFVFFPDPLDRADILTRGFLSIGEEGLVADEEGISSKPFFQGMSPLEAEWACDGLGIDYRSYLRVAIVDNPFSRMVELYERIAATDPIWRARQAAGLGKMDFASWLQRTRPDGPGAAGKNGPRWRKFGAWSARYWCGDHINHVIRLEAIEEDVIPVLDSLGVAPAFDTGFGRRPKENGWQDYYDDNSAAVIVDRYGWDLAQYGYGSPLRRAG